MRFLIDEMFPPAHPDPYLGLHWPKVSPRRR